MEELQRKEDNVSTANYIWQPIVGMIFFGVALVFINWTATSKMLWAACAGALAASTYMVFAMPASVGSRWYNILSGYVFGIVFGEILHWLAIFFEWVVSHTFALPSVHVYEFTAFIGILFVIWFKLLFKIVHPPALVLVVSLMMIVENYLLLLTTLAGAILLTILKVILAPALRDLTNDN